MAWSADTGIQVQNLITQIATRLTASGWTLTDRSQDQVWDATNNQGVHQYVQITNVGAYQYLQFQAWQSWNTGTHAGANGSGTSVARVYYAPNAVAGTVTVDLYMSVTANRVIIYIQGQTNYRNWAYFGGLDSLAGTSDPFCALLLTSYTQANNKDNGAILQASGGGNYWPTIEAFAPCALSPSDTLSGSFMAAQILGNDSSQLLIFPVMIVDTTVLYIRGNLDGLCFCPIGSGVLGNLDTVIIGGVTYLVVIPGGPTGNFHALTGNYGQGIAIVEA